MENATFAELNDAQLSEINALEQKLGVTLIAYELIPNNVDLYNEDSMDSTSH